MLYYEDVIPFEPSREEIIGVEASPSGHLYQPYGYDPHIKDGGYYPVRSVSYHAPPHGSYVSRNLPPYVSLPQVLPSSYSYTPSPSPREQYQHRSPPPSPRGLRYSSPRLESFYDIPRDHLTKMNMRVMYHEDREDYVIHSPRENSYLSYPDYGRYSKLHGKLVDMNRMSCYNDSIPICPEQIPQLPQMLDTSIVGMSFRDGNGDDGGDRKRKFQEDIEDDDIPTGFKLPASKSPIMEAMAYCAIKKWGIEIVQFSDSTEESPAKVFFRVIDFEQYYKYSCLICSKQNPTEDIGSRVKSLRRWFVNFPKKRDRRENPQFTLEVKPEVSKKVYEMIEKYKCQISVMKRRRTTKDSSKC